LDARFPRRVLLWPVAVQGERAAGEVAGAIRGFNALPVEGGPIPRPDLLIVARGGGSIEDLMAFNEEIVVRAAAESSIPLISAVGHETDTTLIDFASDRRAPTPTAAAEMAVPVRAELVAEILDLERRNLRCFTRGLTERRKHFLALGRSLPRADSLFALPRQRFDRVADSLGNALRRNVEIHARAFLQTAALLRAGSVARRLETGSERLKGLAHRLERCFRARLVEWWNQANAMGRVLETVSHKAVLDRGFALVRGADGSIRRRAGQVVVGERLKLTFADGTVQSRAEGNEPASEAKGKPRKQQNQGSLF
jgi:exodeoxyribonuclease VII large subunit